jgi:hypothetical protein
MASRRPYSVLLPVGFAVPPPLPSTRCALTAPFHPYHGQLNAPRRYVFCGTIPGFAPAGCYPAPLVRGARTFLSGNLSVSPERPSDRLTPQAWGYQASPSRPAARRLRQKLKDQGAARSIGVRARAAMVLARPRLARSSCKVVRVDGSAWPSTRSGRKWR